MQDTHEHAAPDAPQTPVSNFDNLPTSIRIQQYNIGALIDIGGDRFQITNRNTKEITLRLLPKNESGTPRKRKRIR